ncbi:hypothetical protein MKX03_000776 [Papaver bracteatum]|nr:hypothetical protein MKX03_000776 [Papaver bracteatum]
MVAFSHKEDVVLIRAFCALASEPLIAAFGNDTARSTKSLQCRISNLKKYVKIYISHVRVCCWGMAAGGYNVVEDVNSISKLTPNMNFTMYRLGQVAYEEQGKRWTDGAVFEILKTQFGREYDPEFFPTPFQGNTEDGAKA